MMPVAFIGSLVITSLVWRKPEAKPIKKEGSLGPPLVRRIPLTGVPALLRAEHCCAVSVAT